MKWTLISYQNMSKVPYKMVQVYYAKHCRIKGPFVTNKPKFLKIFWETCGYALNYVSTRKMK